MNRNVREDMALTWCYIQAEQATKKNSTPLLQIIIDNRTGGHKCFKCLHSYISYYCLRSEHLPLTKHSWHSQRKQDMGYFGPGENVLNYILKSSVVFKFVSNWIYRLLISLAWHSVTIQMLMWPQHICVVTFVFFWFNVYNQHVHVNHCFKSYYVILLCWWLAYTEHWMFLLFVR